MLITLCFASFVFGIVVAIIWVGKEGVLKKSSFTIPDGFTVVIEHLRKASIPNQLNYLMDTVRTESEAKRGDHLYTKDQVEECFEQSTWQRLAYEDFKTKILAKSTGLKTFPCVYATMGYRSNDHRYLFLKSDDPSEPQNIRLIGPALESYLKLAPSLGPNTSLVIVGAPSASSKTVEKYNEYFWSMLRGLRISDPCPWPGEIPSKTESEKWTFCYNGQPVFPVMLTPAHSRRYSRQMSVPLIALQPKWVLDQLMSTPKKRESATGKVRKLLKDYDSIGISSDLTTYGEAGTSESRQLCLSDEDSSVICPYEDLDR